MYRKKFLLGKRKGARTWVHTYIHTYTYVHTNFAVYLPDKLTRQLWSLIREFLRRLNDRPNRLKEAAGSSLRGSCFL